jgi:hypothetical protein
MSINGKSILGRVAVLEAATPHGTRRVVSMWRDADEPVAAAIARWCADHPGEPAPSENDPNVLIVMRVFHDPPRRENA